jgi:hypothetical protein
MSAAIKLVTVLATVACLSGLGVRERTSPKAANIAGAINGNNGVYVVKGSGTTNGSTTTIEDGSNIISAYGCRNDCTGIGQFTLSKSGSTYTIVRFESSTELGRLLNFRSEGNKFRAQVERSDGTVIWVPFKP